MKKVLAVIITMLLILACTAVHAEAFNIDDYYPLTPEEVKAGILYDPVSHFSYALQEDGTIRLVRYIQVNQIDIPEEINGIPVSRLGGYAFYNTSVTDIFLSAADIHIDDFAFDGCNATIWIPGNHPTLSTATVLMRKDPYSAEYIPESWNIQKLKYYYNFDDDK